MTDKDDLKKYLLAYAKQELNIRHSSNNFCPFCKNSRSFSIDESFNHFQCFNPSCEWNKKGGDIFDLVEYQTGIIEFKDKISYLTKYIEENQLQPTTPKKEKQSKRKKGIEQDQKENDSLNSSIDKMFLDFKNKDLMNNEAIKKNVFFKRKINEDTLQKYKIGFGKSMIVDSINVLFIPFPESSHFIEWNYNHERNDLPKYFEEGEKEIFNCGIIGRTERPIFVCEGIFDTLSILQEGFEAVCLCSVNQIETFKQYVKEHQPKNNLIILLDNDEAGKEASSSLCAGLWENEIIYLDESKLLPSISSKFKKHFKDINEVICYSEHSQRYLKACLKNAEDYASKEFERLYSKRFRRKANKK